MNKIRYFLAYCILLMFVAKSEAQNFSVYPFTGYSFDNRGRMLQEWLTPKFGVDLGLTIPRTNNFVFVGLGMESGQKFLYPISRIDTTDSSITEILDKINAPALSFTTMLSVPEEVSERFSGPVMGASGGVAFPTLEEYPLAGFLKVMIQLNVNIAEISAIGIGVGMFARSSFYFLYTSRTSFSSSIESGLKISLGKKGPARTKKSSSEKPSE